MRRVLLSLLLLAWPHVAQAQDTTQARALFEQGLAAAHDAHWEDARTAFEQSLAISERPSTLLNLAGAEVQTGHLVSAGAHYRRFLEIATRREAAHRHEAETALASVESRIAHVTLVIDGRQPGDEVRLDQVVLMPGTLGAPIAIDPGSHVVLVIRNGRHLEEHAFQAADGAQTEVTLSLVPTTAAPEPIATAPVEAIEEPPPAASDDTPWIIVGVCAGVAVAAGVAIGVAFAVQPSGPTPYQGNFGAGVVRF